MSDEFAVQFIDPPSWQLLTHFWTWARRCRELKWNTIEKSLHLSLFHEMDIRRTHLARTRGDPDPMQLGIMFARHKPSTFTRGLSGIAVSGPERAHSTETCWRRDRQYVFDFLFTYTQAKSDLARMVRFMTSLTYHNNCGFRPSTTARILIEHQQFGIVPANMAAPMTEERLVRDQAQAALQWAPFASFLETGRMVLRMVPEPEAWLALPGGAVLRDAIQELVCRADNPVAVDVDVAAGASGAAGAAGADVEGGALAAIPSRPSQLPRPELAEKHNAGEVDKRIVKAWNQLRLVVVSNCCCCYCRCCCC